MFGYRIIRDEEMLELNQALMVAQRVNYMQRWFSGWKDLDIIWEYLLSANYFDSIDRIRDQYAAARSTDCHGNPVKNE